MTWRGYAGNFLLANLVLGAIVWVLFMAQGNLPLNPDECSGHAVGSRAAHHGVVPHQHQSATLFRPGAAVVSIADGRHRRAAGHHADVRLGGAGRDPARAVRRPRSDAATEAAKEGAAAEGQERDVGNFWVDITRGTLRILLPLCLLWSLLLAWQGCPVNAHARCRCHTDRRQRQAWRSQHIPVGPVAPMVAVKQLGTNGGGWYGPNSAVALENPTPLVQSAANAGHYPAAGGDSIHGRAVHRPAQDSVRSCLPRCCSCRCCRPARRCSAENSPVEAARQRDCRSDGRQGSPQRRSQPRRCGAALTTQTSNGSVNDA